jgi:hypothetical protein
MKKHTLTESIDSQTVTVHDSRYVTVVDSSTNVETTIDLLFMITLLREQSFVNDEIDESLRQIAIQMM